MKPSLGSQKGLVSLICASAWPGVMPYLCIRNAHVTVADRDLPMTLRVMSDFCVVTMHVYRMLTPML